MGRFGVGASLGGYKGLEKAKIKVKEMRKVKDLAMTDSARFRERPAHSPGSSIQKLVHFLPFNLCRGSEIFLFTRKLPEARFFSRLDSDIYFSRSEIFPYSKFFCCIFPKLCIVSRNFFYFNL